MLKQATETREVITVAVGEICLRGTFHRPRDHRSGPGLSKRNRFGILFLNHGFLPRTAPGDSAVHWADSFAEQGYPCFRIDLTGLGDSDGDVPADLLDYINAGGYASILSAAIKELTERFSLSGVVILGHCSSAVTALFSAALSKECMGLVLTDPYFHLARERNEIQMELRHWASWSRLGALSSDIYYYLKYIHLLVRGNRLPRNANSALIRCWDQLASAGLPILILKAPVLKGRGTKPRVGDFDYLGYLEALSGRGSRVVIKLMEGTNHSFAGNVATAAVRECTGQWLNEYFPFVEYEEAATVNNSA